MAHFEGNLDIRDNDGFPFILLAPLTFHSDVLKRAIVVPAGFKTDYASIPAGLWNLIPKVGKYDKAAVIHDFLYVNNGCTRGEADAVLNEGMGVLGVPGWRRKLIYAGVRIGGWKSWGRYRELQAGK